MALLALSALALSKAFVDYSTSGLENALTHLLLVLFFLARTSSRGLDGRDHAIWSSNPCWPRSSCSTGSTRAARPSCAGVDRVAQRFRPAGRVRGPARPRAWLPIVLGLLPLVAWEIFSIIYYGFPFPNTACSKIKTGIPEPELLQQGFCTARLASQRPADALGDRRRNGVAVRCQSRTGRCRRASRCTSCTWCGWAAIS